MSSAIAQTASRSGSLEKVHNEHIDRKPVGQKTVNPLHGIPREKLVRDVQAFVIDKGLEEYTDDLIKGALVAQNPAGFENFSELSENEKVSLRRETSNKWSQPWPMYATVVLVSIGAAVQGWDQTGSNGANLSFPMQFGIHSTPENPNSTNEWIVGIVNAGPYISSALLGCWISDPVNSLVGRRGAMFIAAIFCLFPVIGSALSQNWQQLLVNRLLMGIGMGMKGSTAPIYAAENTPASIRGGLVMCWQLWTAFGIFIGFAANLVCLEFGGDDTWRYQLGSAFIPAVPLVLGVFFCPESPRWYMKKGRYPQAYKSFLMLRNTPLQAARDLYYVHSQLLLEEELHAGGNFFTRFGELFTIPRVRRATLASFVVMLAQQMCGINIIAFYSSTIFVESGATERTALISSLGFGLVNFIFALPAVWTIDRFGRRNLLLSTFPNMAWSLLAAGFCFWIPVDNKARLPLIALFIYIFGAFYSPGEGPVPFTYSAEAFPLSHREVGMSWAVAVCLGFAAILSLTFPRMLGALGPQGAFGLYAAFNMIAFVAIFLLLPETKQRTLEELDYTFSVPTATHASYQVKKSLPYFIKRWIFMRKDTKLEPLYDFEVEEYQDVYENDPHSGKTSHDEKKLEA